MILKRLKHKEVPHVSSSSAPLVLYRHNQEQLDPSGAPCRGEGGRWRREEGECNWWENKQNKKMKLERSKKIKEKESAR